MTAWQPGDPVYPREPDVGVCADVECDTTWSPPGFTECPTCGGPPKDQQENPT